MKLALAFALPLVLSFAAVRWATHVADVPAAPAAVQAPIHWANRDFASQADFSVWLQARGASYERWAETHPKLAREAAAPTGAGAAQLDRQHAIRRLRSLVLAAVIAALALAAATPIAHRVRRQRRVIYTPSLRGQWRWWFDTTFGPHFKSTIGKELATDATRESARYGTPVVAQRRLTPIDFLLSRATFAALAGWITGGAFCAFLAYALL